MTLATCELIYLKQLPQELRFQKDEQMKFVCDNHGLKNRIYRLIYPISVDTDTISANDSCLLEISLFCQQYL